MAHQQWSKGKKRRWTKIFYEPFDDIDLAALGLRFTLHLPVNCVLPLRWPLTWHRLGRWCRLMLPRGRSLSK
jgi:hypothetical protein